LPPKIRLMAITTGLLLGVASQSTEGQETTDAIEVVVVSGRQPGPPLWKVTHGENTLWVLPLVPVVPRAMDWDESRVASLIAASDEVIDPPGVSIGVSKLLLLNPLNWIRGPRLYDRLSHNSGKQTLQDVLPPDLWERYAALKQRYFPRDTDVGTLRPSFAIAAMNTLILEAEKLTGSRQIEHRVEKLIDHQPAIRRTRTEVEEKMEGGYGELSARLQRLADSLPGDDELACFNTQLELYERHIDDMKRAANAWATGHARDIESYSRLGEMEDPCTRLLLASSEGSYMEELIDQSSTRWLAAAETALAHNHITFAMLPMIHVTGTRSLIDRLEARGYAVRAPQ
jgi:hypothetical protein